MKEKYIKYKYDFSDYILLLKSGNFYVCLNKDACILSNILNYKIINCKNFIKTGFPISSLSKVINFLNDKKINYLIIDKEIIDKVKFEENGYFNYLNNNYINNINRINKIYEVLKNNINYPNLETILNDIESNLCKINF